MFTFRSSPTAWALFACIGKHACIHMLYCIIAFHITVFHNYLAMFSFPLPTCACTYAYIYVYKLNALLVDPA